MYDGVWYGQKPPQGSDWSPWVRLELKNLLVLHGVGVNDMLLSGSEIVGIL